MSWLLDTNIVSELRKGDRCDRNLWAWYERVEVGDLHLSVLVLGEIRKGIELLRSREPERARAIDIWLAAVEQGFAGRVLPIDGRVAQAWGRIAAIRSVPVIDALMAATALVHGLTLVTRNARDVAGLGAEVLDPFRPPSPAPAPGRR